MIGAGIIRSLTGASRRVYWPICRMYARRLGDRPADAVLRSLCKLQFVMVNHFWPDFVRPRRFSEKVWARQLMDRGPMLTLVSDKLRVRDYVVEKGGSNYLIPLYWSGSDPENVPFDCLPMKFVMKTNHGCGYVIIVDDKKKLNQDWVKRQLKKWLAENFAKDTYLGVAWGYRNVRPNIMVEAFVGENDKTPVDYKFWCFGGRVEFVSLHFDRFENHSTLCFDRGFREGSGFDFGLPTYAKRFEVPSNGDEMVRMAETLAAGFPFLRVDMYNVDGRIYFGELTPYPGGVSTRFLPVERDIELGRKWKE